MWVLMAAVMSMVTTMFLLPKCKPCRAVVKIQEGGDNSQECSKGEANNESDLDVVVARWVVRELSLVKC
jgi:hypothetical protein